MIAFFLSPLGRKIGLAIGIVLLILGAYRYAYSQGHEAGSLDGKREQLQDDKKAFEQDRAVFLKQLSDLQGKVDEANNRVQQSVQSTILLKQALDKIPRSVPANVTEPPKDSAAKLADYDALFQENQQRKQIEAEQDKTIKALQETNALLIKQRDVAVQFGDEMVKHYTLAYNSAQKRNWIQRLFHLKGKHLDLPTPASLIQK